MAHKENHPLAGQVVTIRCSGDPDGLNGAKYLVEDWWDRVAGKSWMGCDGNPACLKYAIRSAFAGLPTDNEVLYGKVGAFGHLIHVSEIEE